MLLFSWFWGVQFWWYNNINTRNTLQLIFSNFDCVESSKYVFDHLIKSWLTKLPTFSQYRWQTLLCCSLSLSESSHRRAKKKNTSHGNEVLPQETIHLMQRPCYQQRLCQDQAGNWLTWRPPDHCKEMQTAVVWTCLPFIRSSCIQWKGEEDKADRGRSGKTTSGNGLACSLPSPMGQWRTVKNGGNWLRNHLWCPNDSRS